MKSLILFAILFFAFANAFAQPDVRDSIILESKTVTPGAGPGYVTVKVWITNKDSLTVLNLSLIERALVTSCGGYLVIAQPRTFAGVVNRMTNTLGGQFGSNFGEYNSSSPDRFRITATYAPENPADIEPPNSTRKLIWEIKFDSVLNSPQIIELDTGTVDGPTSFVSTLPGNIPVNFVKSVITVDAPSIKGDLNLDCEVKTSDVVRELQCVLLESTPEAGRDSCDLNCDGQISPADVVVFLNYEFLAENWPC